MVGTLGRRTTDRERRQGWNWNVVFKKMDTVLKVTGWLSKRALHQGE